MISKVPVKPEGKIKASSGTLGLKKNCLLCILSQNATARYAPPKQGKQERGRNENQETGGATQHRGTVSLNRPSHQANQTREGRRKTAGRTSPRGERRSSSNRSNQMKTIPRDERTEILRNPCKWGEKRGN